MNFSDIRKKAQQDRQDGQEQNSVKVKGSVDDGVEVQSISPVTPTVPKVASPLPSIGQSSMPESERMEPSRVVEPPHWHFDPVSLILAGRHDALETEEAEIDDTVEEAQGLERYEECLCFRVSTERYAISIMEIKEITKPREMTEVPRVPAFVPGVISLRGVIVPIFDLGQRLRLPKMEITRKARIIVVKKGEDLSGILVDEVIQVVKVPSSTIEQPPAILEGIDREFVRGIGRYDGRMLILLHLGNILDLTLT